MAISNLQAVTHYGKSTQITSDTLIRTGPGVAAAIIVSSHTTGSIKLWDALSATGTVLVDTYTYATGSQVINLFGAAFAVGLFADVSGTQSITVVYNF